MGHSRGRGHRAASPGGTTAWGPSCCLPAISVLHGITWSLGRASSHAWGCPYGFATAVGHLAPGAQKRLGTAFWDPHNSGQVAFRASPPPLSTHLPAWSFSLSFLGAQHMANGAPRDIRSLLSKLPHKVPWGWKGREGKWGTDQAEAQVGSHETQRG